MLNKEASRNRSVEGLDKQKEVTIVEGLSNKYPWWSPVAAIRTAAGLVDKAEDMASLFGGKSTRV
jgi:hypothetical protein